MADAVLDIASGVRKEDGVVRGTGMLAWVPGAPVGAVAPGRYAI